jgi:hypothetical protein
MKRRHAFDSIVLSVLCAILAAPSIATAADQMRRYEL